MHYLNNAGAGLMTSDILDVMVSHLQRERQIGAYRAAQESRSLMEEFYERAAHIVNANNASEIAYTDSASRSWIAALHGAVLNPGDVIVTLSTEFGTNLLTLFDRAITIGASVHIIQCDACGSFDIEEITSLLENGARMVAVSHAAAHGSIVNPVQEMGKIIRKYKTIYLVDGCQAVGQIPVNVQDIGCDAYTATGRKWLRGPRGTGFLYVNSASALRSSTIDIASADLAFDADFHVTGVDVRRDARQFELWERNIAAMLGLSRAIDQYLTGDADSIANTIHQYADRLRAAVCSNPRLELVGASKCDSGIVGFYCRNVDHETVVKQTFEKKEVGFSTMSSWDCPLHFPKTGATCIFRLSPHYYTPIESIESVSLLVSDI